MTTPTAATTTNESCSYPVSAATAPLIRQPTAQWHVPHLDEDRIAQQWHRYPYAYADRDDGGQDADRLHEYLEGGQLCGAVRMSRLECAHVRASLSPANTEGISPETNTMNSESGAKSGAFSDVKAFPDRARHTRVRIDRSIDGPLTADTSRITIAIATPIVSTGNPLDFRSSHT